LLLRIDTPIEAAYFLTGRSPTHDDGPVDNGKKSNHGTTNRLREDRP